MNHNKFIRILFQEGEEEERRQNYTCKQFGELMWEMYGKMNLHTYDHINQFRFRYFYN